MTVSSKKKKNNIAAMLILQKCIKAIPYRRAWGSTAELNWQRMMLYDKRDFHETTYTSGYAKCSPMRSTRSLKFCSSNSLHLNYFQPFYLCRASTANYTNLKSRCCLAKSCKCLLPKKDFQDRMRPTAYENSYSCTFTNSAKQTAIKRKGEGNK